MFYSVVLLDGKERQNLSLEEVKDLFFKRQINQDSLICSSENPTWQMLRRAFNLTHWIPAAAPAAPGPPPTGYQNPFQAQTQPFEQPLPPNNQNYGGQPNQANPFQTAAPVTFNQFPADQPVNPKNPYAANASNGYSQNNQTETYYQAETNNANYDFQNNRGGFAPSKYNNPATAYDYSAKPADAAGARNGAKQAAVFLLVNAFFYLALSIVAAFFEPSGATDEAEKFGRGFGRSFIPLVIDLILAVRLWKLDNVESARKWVLVRSYVGFIIFGLVIPIGAVMSGNLLVGVFSIVSSFFYFISLAIVLHGKENPSSGRVMIGMGTFAIYFLVMFGTISLSVVGRLAPNIAKMNLPDSSQLAKYKVEGKEFQDKTTGAKILLPDGWSMISLDNPLIHTPEARMIAIDGAGNQMTILEVVPVPGNLDMKRQNSTQILDILADGVVESLKTETGGRGGFASDNSIREVTRLNVYIGTHPAKLMVFDKTQNGQRAKGHLIITYDELTFYVLQSWCPFEEYDKAQADFTFFEKNFVVPEKINSAFTQSAETQKNSGPKKKL